MHKVDKSYETLLNRIQGDLAHASKKDSARLEIPEPQIIWVGQRTIFRNFMEFPKALRYVRDYVICPVCQSPDTRTEKVKKLGFLVCEACGARSSIKGNYA